jgi:hypothetical protein
MSRTQTSDSPRLDKTRCESKPALPGNVNFTVLIKEIIMNAKQVIAAAALTVLGSSAAFAQSEIDLQYFGQQQSAVTRAEVRADVLKAQAAGTLNTPSEVLAAASPAKSGVSRAQVSSQIAKADLTTPAEVTAAAVPQSGLSREAVRAEARAYARTDIYKDKARIGAGF